MAKISYDIDAMNRCCNSLNSCSQRLLELKQGVEDAKKDLDAGWKGKAADLFKSEYMETLKDSLAKYSDMIDTFSELLTKITTMYNQLTIQAESLKV
ncbi:MAG: WXG100 family type VII secretion target [Clostridia bacterium]|jgi:WXG100 family type VII secretion target|nr:WXG100 family type VII secretion target [Clostridia bacterium]